MADDKVVAAEVGISAGEITAEGTAMLSDGQNGEILRLLKEINDSLKSMNQVQQKEGFFSQGGGGGVAVGLTAAITAGVVGALEATMIPKEILQNEFEKMDQALASIKKTTEELKPLLAQTAIDSANNGLATSNANITNTNSAQAIEGVQKRINEIMKDNVVSQEEFNELGGLMNQLYEKRKELTESLVNNSAMDAEQMRSMLALKSQMIDTENRMVQLRQSYLQTGQMNIQQLTQELQLQQQIAEAAREASLYRSSDNDSDGFYQVTDSSTGYTYEGRNETLNDGNDYYVGIRTVA